MEKVKKCTRPGLILEGAGDKQSVPNFIRQLLVTHEVFDIYIQPDPILKQNIPRLRSAGQLERFIKYGASREGDSILLLLDSDAHCPNEIVVDFSMRIEKLPIEKKIGIGFFKCEFEVYFLYCLDLIAERYPEYGWNLGDWNPDSDFETIINAKGFLSKRMKKGRSYKATRDQAKFASVIQFDRLRAGSRSFRHFESLLLWLVGKGRNDGNIYPAPLRP